MVVLASKTNLTSNTNSGVSIKIEGAGRFD